jgi:deoxycytidine triphosphate deaminase
VQEGDAYVFIFLPRRFYLVKTAEAVNMPPSLVGVIRPRTTTFRCGAILQCADIAPGYRGELTFGLIYFGDRPLRIERHARIASLRFSVLDGAEDYVYDGVWQGGRVSTDGEETRAH